MTKKNVSRVKGTFEIREPSRFFTTLVKSPETRESHVRPPLEVFSRLSCPARLFRAKFRICVTLFQSFSPCHKIHFRSLLVRHIVSRKTWKSPYLANVFLESSPKPGKILKQKICLLESWSSFSCSQIWLFPLVDACHFLTTSQHWMKKMALPWKPIFFPPNYKLNNHYYTFRLFIYKYGNGTSHKYLNLFSMKKT